ncbi:MAG: hypothetical protein ACREPV_06055 [Lysobacter sp.]
MTHQAHDPLTSEERELAARLARIGPHGEPSPALDARILGAAQTAAARKPAPGGQRRWPAWAGLAATLALALGAVWQLRPVQEMPVVLEEAPSAAIMRQPSDAAAPGEAAVAVDMISGNGEAEPERAAKAIATRPPPAAEARAAKVAPPESTARAQRSRMPPPPVVFDDPSPVDVPAPAPPAAAAPRSRNLLAPSAAPMSVSTESVASDAQSADAATGATVTVIDLPVASDSRLPPVDWIERIRQRRDAGDLASARASLALLQHDYPRLPLPDDVRAIAAPPPSDR